MNKIIPKSIITLFIILLGWSVSAQQVLLKIADKQFNNKQYISAQENYLKVVKSEYSSAKLFQNLGDTYYYNGKLEEASKWYKKLIDSYPTEIDPEYYFKYALSLKSIEDYETSDFYMEKFADLKLDDSRAFKFETQRNYLKRIRYQSDRYQINNENINTKFTDFGTAFYGDYIVFSSSRDTLLLRQRTHKWTEESFLELFQAAYDTVTGELSNVSKFSEKINSKFHESSTAFTNNGNTIYFTRNSIEKTNEKADVIRLNIYTATKNSEGKWTEPQSLPFNNKEYSVAHPSISADGKTLYFSSDMPGGYGLSDIYKVSINENGSYGTPENMGNNINTEGKETFPFISSADELYFSSDGHPGLGGIDIFTLNKSAVVNVGAPINSSKDDFAFIIKGKNRKGYFSSNREKKNGDEIYSFQELYEIKSFYPEAVMGFIKDENSQESLAGARVAIYDKENNLISEMIVEEDGKYYFANSDIERVNKIVVTKEGYKSYEQVTNFQEFEEVFESQVSLEQVNTFVLLVDPKHFNESNTEILPESKKELNEIIKQLKASKSIDVLLISYLDEEETDLTIAKNRAKLVLQYFVDNGLDEKRFAYKGVRQNTVRVERVFRLLLEIPPIHFESNSGQLQSDEYPELEKVISIMNEHLDARIEVQGHADSRGSKSTNIKVSNKRAQSIVEYLVKKGIARDRLVAKGYGESRLRNKCSDGVTCSDKEHKFNRRVEFMVIE